MLEVLGYIRMFCSYSSMKLLYSVVCISYFECATIRKHNTIRNLNKLYGISIYILCKAIDAHLSEYWPHLWNKKDLYSNDD